MIRKVFLTLLLTVTASALFSQNKGYGNSIEVVGSATIKVKPDVANITIIISESDPAVKSIGVEKAEKNLYNILKKMHLNPDENLTISNAYSDIKNRRNGVISKTYTLKLTEVDKISNLFENLESERIMNVALKSFEVSNSEEIKQNLRALAVKNGHEKAKVLAEAANAKVGQILTIIDDERDYNYPVAVRNNATFNSERGGVSDSSIDLALTDIQFRSNVTTIWLIDRHITDLMPQK